MRLIRWGALYAVTVVAFPAMLAGVMVAIYKVGYATGLEMMEEFACWVGKR